MTKKTEKPATGSQRVYDVMRQRILNLELAPGTEIDELELAEEFGISRTPIREAVIRLVAEELLTMSPNRSAKVPHLDFEEVGELFDALEVCQRVIARWAALRRTSEHLVAMREAAHNYAAAARKRQYETMREENFKYHAAFGEACGNRYYQRLNASLLTRSLRLAQLTIREAPPAKTAYDAYFKQVNDEHALIVDLIEQRNPDAAEDMIRDHIRQFRVRSLDVLHRNMADTIKLD